MTSGKAPLTPQDAARAWVEAWSDGWSRHDPDVIGARYANDCRFRSQPFRSEGPGRQAVADYARRTFADERSARFAFGEPIVAPDGRAAVEYRAIITSLDGPETTLASTSVLRFNADGLVTEHFDNWSEADGDLGIEIHPEARA